MSPWLENTVSFKSSVSGECVLKTLSSAGLTPTTRAELRASHAGEFGAVWIYRGILFVNAFKKDEDIQAFAQHHLATEKVHLAGFETHIHEFRGSLLLFAWGLAGFFTGVLPSLFGRDWVFYTIFCVESFVDEHYREQLAILNHDNSPLIKEFSHQMKSFHADELAHRDEAKALMTKPENQLMHLWGALVGRGSGFAVKVAKLI